MDSAEREPEQVLDPGPGRFRRKRVALRPKSVDTNQPAHFPVPQPTYHSIPIPPINLTSTEVLPPMDPLEPDVGGSLGAWLRHLTGQGRDIALLTVDGLRNTQLSHVVRLEFAKFAAERGWGKAAQTISNEHQFLGPLTLRIAGMSDVQLAELDEPQEPMPVELISSTNVDEIKAAVPKPTS